MATAAERDLDANAIRKAAAIQHRMDANHDTCDKCEKPVFWAKTTRGKSILMDYEVKPAGMFLLKPLFNDRLLAQRVSLSDMKALPKRTPLYNSHWDVCEKREKSA